VAKVIQSRDIRKSCAPPQACVCIGPLESLPISNTCSYRCTGTSESPCIFHANNVLSIHSSFTDRPYIIRKLGKSVENLVCFFPKHFEYQILFYFSLLLLIWF
jgi:hypothetical protein